MRVPQSIRRVLDPLVGWIRVPVLKGVNRGQWWTIVSAGGYATGRRARVEMELLRDLLEPGDTCWDVGAHHGAMTLLASARVGTAGRVHAFEPSGRNRHVLAAHVRWNRCANVTVHPCALGAADGEARLGGDGTSSAYRLGRGSEVVTVRAGTSLVAAGESAPPTFAKIDVEGAGGEAVAGLVAALAPQARLFIEIHTLEEDARCVPVLRQNCFSLHESRGLLAARTGDPSVPHWCLFAVGPGWPHQARDFARVEAAGF